MLTSLNAASAYGAARQAIGPAQGNPAIEKAAQAAGDFAAMMEQVDRAGTGAMTGQVETQHLVQTIAEADLALQTVVAIRDKVVEAYQEILRMPV
jgi:flagellar hook-basal body complex protein FliE